MPSRTEDVTLGQFCAKLRGDPRAGYLKQCPLEDLGCRWSLRAHAPFLRESTSWVQETAFLWVGGADATTGLHSDDEDNVLLVTHGSKHVLLYPPAARRHLDPNPRYDNGTECCEIDAFLSEAEKARSHPPFYTAWKSTPRRVDGVGRLNLIPSQVRGLRAAAELRLAGGRRPLYPARLVPRRTLARRLGLGERLLQHARGPGDARRAPGPDGLRAQPARALARELRLPPAVRRYRVEAITSVF